MIWGVTDIKRAPKGILRLACERSGRISTGARARTTRANILFGGEKQRLRTTVSWQESTYASADETRMFAPYGKAASMTTTSTSLRSAVHLPAIWVVLKQGLRTWTPDGLLAVPMTNVLIEKRSVMR